LGRQKGFGKVLVNSHLLPRHYIALLRLGREQDYMRAAKNWILSDGRGDF
jgi:hypothetical protein